MSDESET